MKKILITTLLLSLSTGVFSQKKNVAAKLFYQKLKLFPSQANLQDSIHVNDKIAKEEQDFIEREFNVNMSTSDSILYINHGGDDSSTLQYSLLSFSFNDYHEVLKVKKILDTINRISYKTPVLTIYKIYYTKSEILFVSSETPRNPVIKKLLISKIKSPFANLYSVPMKLEN